jgi:hypothetical protein
VLLAPGEGHLSLAGHDSAALDPIRDFLAAESAAEAPVSGATPRWSATAMCAGDVSPHPAVGRPQRDDRLSSTAN